MKDRWSNKSAVIVGGSAGLGRVLAECLASASARRILLVGRDQARLQHAQQALQAAWPGTQFAICSADAATPSGADQIAARLVADGHSHVDLLINAVGQSDRGLALELTGARLDDLLRANVHAPLLATQAIAPLMGSGSVIVNIGSLACLFAPRYLGGYSIAKHGLRALTQQLRLELAERDIHVMLACPGPIQRSDSGERYSELASAGNLPPQALQGGGGAKLTGLDSGQLALDILKAAAARRIQIIRPRQAILLLWLMTLWPAMGERVLRSKSA